MLAFPEAGRGSLARCCGYASPRAGQSHVIQARRTRWWRESHVDEVLGALVAERYGEQGR